MIWIVGAVSLIAGVLIGGAFANKLNIRPSRVQELEKEIRDLKDGQLQYQDSVSDHFSMTAELVQHMTESYKEVYQHLATGAQDLCSAEVASKLLPAGRDAVFETSNEQEDNSVLPPKDYAAKQDPDQKGALSEDFGLNKNRQDKGDDESSDQH